MEQKLLEKVNKMAADLKALHDEKGHNDVFKMEYYKLIGALELISYATGKEYIIHSDGTVTER